MLSFTINLPVFRITSSPSSKLRKHLVRTMKKNVRRDAKVGGGAAVKHCLMATAWMLCSCGYPRKIKALKNTSAEGERGYRGCSPS
ncbi:mCG148111 [Mus musculus]|nr:mCG148111 [Mus musculus]